MIMERASGPVIASRAVADGDLTLLRQAGFEKVREGKTTIAEVLRAVTS
jgi:type II secretory ATPase GspE/PulE/Tfp pilus assembly ATPase PilB-like protein